MRTLFFSILLASAAASPALAQDHGRWHNDDAAQGDRAQAHEQRQEQRQQAREQRFDAGEAARVERQAQQQQVQQQAQQQQFEARRQQNQGQQWQGRGGWDGARQQQVVVQQQQQQQQEQRRYSGGWRGGFDAQAQAQQDQAMRWHRRDNDGQQVQQWQGRQGADRQRDWSRSGQWNQGTRYAGNWNRDWRNDRRYDWRRYRDSHRSIFHIGIYLDPFGYNYYRPFNIGYRLQPYYYQQQYWIDPGLYNLPYPPPGTMWVRYWNDALLVDTYTGEVVDVIRNFFW